MVEKMHFEAIQISVRIMTACFQHVSVYGVLGADIVIGSYGPERAVLVSQQEKKKDTAWQNQEMFFQL